MPHLALPSYSPDLNPIEYAWDILQRRFTNHVPTPEILKQQLLPQLWAKVTQDYDDNLVEYASQVSSNN